MKLIEIAKAWHKVITGNITEEEKRLATERLEACDKCSYKIQLDSVGAFVVAHLNSPDNTFYCGECGCPLAAKVVSTKLCGLKKWPEQQTEDYF
jgi:hypothetical protein